MSEAYDYSAEVGEACDYQAALFSIVLERDLEGGWLVRTRRPDGTTYSTSRAKLRVAAYRMALSAAVRMVAEVGIEHLRRCSIGVDRNGEVVLVPAAVEGLRALRWDGTVTERSTPGEEGCRAS